MKNQEHIFNELVIIFSQDRFNGYLNHTNGKKEALITYSWNIELSKTLYPALQVFEIALRNALHHSIRAQYKTDYWFDLPSILHEKELITVKQAKATLSKDKKPLEPGRIIAELSFGFWTSLFDVRYEHNQILWPKLLKPTFPHIPKGQRTRSFLSSKLNRIRRLRNRIFHHEPIWHWRDLREQHQKLITLLKYISPISEQYLKIIDDFHDIYANGRKNIEEKLQILLNNPTD